MHPQPRPPTPLVEGLRLVERTGAAGAGELWRARITGGIAGASGERLPGELSGVGECLVRLIRLPVDDALRARARTLAAALAVLDDPGLLRVREARPAYDGLALVLAAVPEPVTCLQDLVRSRMLAAGEVVTLGVALSWALEAAHSHGITHGRLRDSDVVLDPEGRPRLAGVGVMGLLGDPGDPSDDVRALVRLLGSVLDLESAGAHRLLAVLREPPAAAGEVAVALAGCAPAAPIRVSQEQIPEPAAAPQASWFGRARRDVLTRLAGAAADRRRSRGPRRGALDGRSRRALRLVPAAAAVLVLAGVIGWISAPSAHVGSKSAGVSPAPTRAPTGATTPTTNAAVPWSAVIGELDTARAAAFARPGSVEVSAFDAPGTAAFRYDASAVEALRSAAAHAVGLRIAVERASLLRRTQREVTLDVTDRRQAYTVTDGQAVLSRTPARGFERHVIVLRDVHGKGPPQWRFADVRARS